MFLKVGIFTGVTSLGFFSMIQISYGFLTEKGNCSYWRVHVFYFQRNVGHWYDQTDSKDMHSWYLLCIVKVIRNPGVSIVGYSQPERFYPIYARLKERRDGAVDRMLIYQPKPQRLTAAEIKTFIVRLNELPVKDPR